MEFLDEEECAQYGPKREDWSYGKNVRTGMIGTFPMDIIYVMPTMVKPPDNFLVRLSIIPFLPFDSDINDNTLITSCLLFIRKNFRTS